MEQIPHTGETESLDVCGVSTNTIKIQQQIMAKKSNNTNNVICHMSPVTCRTYIATYRLNQSQADSVKRIETPE